MTVARSASVTVVIPAWNASLTLQACLDAVAAMTLRPAEVIVFDDGSTDATGDIARGSGARVIRNDGPPAGPAHGRNTAAAAARSDLLLFVDADVVVAPDALELLVRELKSYSAQAAFGSYDDKPLSRRTASLYTNLRHHYVHQHGAREAGTFWAGLGLIDRVVFLDAGGFDVVRFPYPSIEDVELGMRLKDRGHRIRLVPEARAMHCKDWTLRQLWHTDITRRAIPWSRLIAGRGTGSAELNVAPIERVKAMLATASLLFALGAAVQPLLMLAAAVAFSGYVVLNRRFFEFLQQRMTAGQTICAIGLHWCYHLYSAATFAVIAIEARWPAPRILLKPPSIVAGPFITR